MKYQRVLLILLLLTGISFAQRSVCASVDNILTNGYNPYPIHGNYDEFGIVDQSPFLVKVDHDIPRQSFPMMLSCGNWCYVSFDTDSLDGAIPYLVEDNVPHKVFTYRQFGTTAVGSLVVVTPPSASNVNDPRFLMDLDGYKHQTAWDESRYADWEWSDFVSSPEARNESFSVTIEGEESQGWNTVRPYLANINGGNGHYIIYWFIRLYGDLHLDCWMDYEPLDAGEIWNMYGNNYYVYDDEHILNFYMPSNLYCYGDSTVGADIKVMVKSWDANGIQITARDTYYVMAKPTREAAKPGNVSNIPEEYSLKQNYPNPFNPSTTISFSIPEETKVVLKVYDIMGKEVATLLDEHKVAGTYNVKYIANNLSSGVYLYKLVTDSYVEVKKFMLMK